MALEGGAFASITNDPLWQWNDAGAEAAWNELVADYFSNATNELAFSDFLADWFHAPPNPTCDKVGDEFCCSTIGCGSWLFPNAEFNSPAGYILYNSMVYLHRTISVFSDSIIQAQINVNGFAGNIASTFSGVAAEIAEEQQQKLNYDIIQLVLGISLSVFFKKSLPSTPFFKGGDDAEGAALRGSDLGAVPSGIQNAVDPVVSAVTSNKLDPGVGQDWTTAAIFGAFAYVKDEMSTTSSLPIQNNLTTYITYLASVAQNATQLYAEGLFNDPGNLFTVIQQGHVFGSPIREKPVTIAAELTQMLLANTLPFAWSSAHDSYTAVFIAQVIPTDDNGISNVGGGCQNYQLANASGLNCGVDTDNFLCVSAINVNFTKTLYCDGDDAYWLFSATTGPNPVGQIELLISTPEGWDTIDGQNWAGLTQQQFLQT
ncbi:hypothetical protein LTR86_007728 [Recurvomyces mirabilis]|nr:hypothetical protein LTR86_007728 [Recurvomyces mirabilis]